MVMVVPTFLNVDGDGTAVPDRSDGRSGLFLASRTAPNSVGQFRTGRSLGSLQLHVFKTFCETTTEVLTAGPYRIPAAATIPRWASSWAPAILGARSRRWGLRTITWMKVGLDQIQTSTTTGAIGEHPLARCGAGLGPLVRPSSSHLIANALSRRQVTEPVIGGSFNTSRFLSRCRGGARPVKGMARSTR